MDLFRLSNLELDSKLKTLAQKERHLLHDVLLHIHEADRRRLYLQLVYPSLFAYLTKGCGFSRTSAQRRIHAARLITPVPEVAEKIKSGEVSLSQISYLQKAIREKDKTQKVSAEVKQQIVRSICGKSTTESQKIIAQVLDLKLVTQSKETHQKDGSVRLELTFTKEQWETLVHARELLSTTSASNSWMEMFSFLAEKVIQKKTGPSRSFSTAAGVRARQNNISTSLSGRTPIPTASRRNIFNRDKVCQYKDKNTGKICGGKWGLEIDHIQPVWAGGNNEESNLRLLCRQHNQFIYRRQTGVQPTYF